MASEASRGHYDLDKPENITGHYRQSNRTSWKSSVIRITRKPLEPGLKLKIQLLAEFCHPSCDMNFADPREKCESLCIKPTTQRNLKHPGPSVRALITSKHMKIKPKQCFVGRPGYLFSGMPFGGFVWPGWNHLVRNLPFLDLWLIAGKKLDFINLSILFFLFSFLFAQYFLIAVVSCAHITPCPYMTQLHEHMWCNQAKWVWSRNIWFLFFGHFLLGIV